MLMISTAVLFSSVTITAAAQNQPLVFEAASIRPHQGPVPRIGVSMTGQRLTADATTTYGLIMEAYDLKSYQIVLATPNLPVRDKQYDVAAKAEGDVAPTRVEFRQMLQRLLVDRFKLQVHREMHEIPVYALVVGKNRLKLKEAAEDGEATGHLRVVGRNYEITQPKATTSDTAQWMTNAAFLDRPVVDHTGLTGIYDLRLTYTPDLRSNRDSDPAPSDVSIFTRLRSSLA
jgi:uncharacterized protein (TIGR03435 family)